MSLNSSQRRRFREGLGTAFDLDEIKILVSDFLDKDFEDIALDGVKKTRIHKLIGWTERRGRSIELLNGARMRRPKNNELRLIAEELGMTSSSEVDGPIDIDISSISNEPGIWVSNAAIIESLRTVADKAELPRIQLQRVIQERGHWVIPSQFAQKLSELEYRVCRVVTGAGGGTGFLVAPNLVMTNHHVIEPIINNLVSVRESHCLFDFNVPSNGTELAGNRVDFANDWLLAKSPPSASDDIVGGPDPGDSECDYAILKLADAVGEQPIGPPTEDPNAAIRGWVEIGDPPPPGQSGAEVFVLQHPRQKRMRLTFGRILGFNNSGNRLRHDANTRRGSSGSPCFNADLDLIALHHAGDPNFDPQHRPIYNQAVPLTPILNQLKKVDGLQKFWSNGLGG